MINVTSSFNITQLRHPPHIIGKHHTHHEPSAAMALKPSWFVPFVFHFTASWLTSLRKKHQKQHIIRKHPPTSSPDPLPQPTSSNHHTPTPTAASNTDGARIHDGTACQSQPVSIDLFTFWSSRHTHTVLEDRASLYVAYRVVVNSLNSHAGGFARSSGQTWSVEKVEGFDLLVWFETWQSFLGRKTERAWNYMDGSKHSSSSTIIFKRTETSPYRRELRCKEWSWVIFMVFSARNGLVFIMVVSLVFIVWNINIIIAAYHIKNE
jgi:hypothetical protein